MSDSRPKVGISLLSWNQYEDTSRCLASLRKSEFRPATILVFDNGSTDGSAERLKAEFPEIELVSGGQNHGFAEGNNRAAKILLDTGMDYIWILNNDTEVTPDCLGVLVHVLENNPDMGAAGAKIWFMDGQKSLCYAGASFNRWTFNTRFPGFRTEDVGHYDHPGDVSIMTGCCMLIRAEVILKVGLFNRAFFAYGEDIDWSLRSENMGIRKYYEPRATLWHKMFGASVKGGGGGVPKSSPQIEFLLSRNRFILVRLHTKPWSLRRGIALAYHVWVRRWPRAMGLLLKRDRRAAGIAAIRGLWAGWRFMPDPSDCMI